MSQQPKYFFSPTLLDAFNGFLSVERNWAKFYGEMEEDNEKYISLADYEQKQYEELIDKINRVKHEPIEAAAKGTAFNDIVDTLLHNKCCGKTQLSRIYDDAGNIVGIRAMVDGFTFDFDYAFCKYVSIYFGGKFKGEDGTVINDKPSDICMSQVLVEATIETRYGAVELYGFIDEMRRDIVYDIKTTSHYEFGKYQEYNQRFIYPYCLIESGMVTEINFFEFTAFALKGGNSRIPLISGTQYSEVYNYNHEQAKRHIKDTCERFREFIEANRDKITDTNIFTKHSHNH